MEQLTNMLDSGGADVAVYCVYKKQIKARDSRAAVKAATISDDSVDEGVYVAVPMGSFQPRRVKQTIDVIID